MPAKQAVEALNSRDERTREKKAQKKAQAARLRRSALSGRSSTPSDAAGGSSTAVSSDPGGAEAILTAVERVSVLTAESTIITQAMLQQMHQNQATATQQMMEVMRQVGSTTETLAQTLQQRDARPVFPDIGSEPQNNTEWYNMEGMRQ